MPVIDLRPDLDVVERWMRQWPGLPVIVAIHINPETGIKGFVEGKSFGMSDDPTQTDMVSLRRWIWERQGGDVGWANIYFHPNSLIKPINKKASASDVKALTTLHVDVDCRAGEDQEQGIARIVSLLKKLRGKEGTILTPSDIITSGGGAQAYWRMEAPVPINGNADVIADLQRYNVHIKMELEGDDCQSLDHIMRMPGTVNIPDEKKRAKGRKPRLATWEYHDATARFSLGMFHKAAPEDTAGVARAKAKDWDVKWSHEPIAQDDQRLNGLTSAWKLIGLKGDTKGEYKGLDGKTNRSDMAFAFVTACMRSSPPVSDDAIAQILMDVGWEVGSCIRDKGATVKRHLNRIIERAHKFVAEDIEKPAILTEHDWVKTARQFMLRVWPDLKHLQANFYTRRRHFYEAIEDDSLASKVRMFLNESFVYADPSPKPFRPNTNSVNEAVGALRDITHMDRTIFKPPCWLEDADVLPPPHECAAFPNGILHVPTRTLLEPTTNYMNLSGLEFCYDAKAPEPKLFLDTLAQYWPSIDGCTPKEHLLLQEIMGYLLTQDNSLQKLFLFLGPTRGGKGLLSRIMEKMVGDGAVVHPSMSTLSGDFGAATLIDKSLAVISEVGFGRFDDRVAVTDFLKRVSGGDGVNLNRKNKDHWAGKLLTRFLIISNVIPNFSDDSRAIGARLVPLRFNISFEGREDKTLEERLNTELPGILNWALDGYDRLMEENDGRFTEPETSAETREEFSRMASPVRTWVQECCTVGGTDFSAEDALYSSYKMWSERNNQYAVNKTQFIEAIIAGFSGTCKRHRDKIVEGSKASRPRGIKGLRLNGAQQKTKESDEQTDANQTPNVDLLGREDKIPF